MKDELSRLEQLERDLIATTPPMGRTPDELRALDKIYEAAVATAKKSHNDWAEEFRINYTLCFKNFAKFKAVALSNFDFAKVARLGVEETKSLEKASKLTEEKMAEMKRSIAAAKDQLERGKKEDSPTAAADHRSKILDVEHKIKELKAQVLDLERLAVRDEFSRKIEDVLKKQRVEQQELREREEELRKKEEELRKKQLAEQEELFKVVRQWEARAKDIKDEIMDVDTYKEIRNFMQKVDWPSRGPPALAPPARRSVSFQLSDGPKGSKGSKKKRRAASDGAVAAVVAASSSSSPSSSSAAKRQALGGGRAKPVFSSKGP